MKNLAKLDREARRRRERARIRWQAWRETVYVIAGMVLILSAVAIFT